MAERITGERGGGSGRTPANCWRARQLVQDVAFGQTDRDNLRLREFADLLRERPVPAGGTRRGGARPAAAALMDARPDRSASTTYDRALRVTVDPVRARFGAWYEMFPRSCTPDPARSGTFREAEARLPDIAAMGFDVAVSAADPSDRPHASQGPQQLADAPSPATPAARGRSAPTPAGTPRSSPASAPSTTSTASSRPRARLGLDVALDIAFQASPDHPWVREHPEWFKHRPDGTIKYAENPPKKYQDIYPLDFESADWQSLWARAARRLPVLDRRTA